MAFVRRLATDVAFYGVLDVLQRAVSVLLVPVYTRVLSQQDFGNLDLIFTACGLLQVVVDMQQTLGFMRFYPESLRNGTEKRFVGTNLLTRMALGAFIAAAFLGLGRAGYVEVNFVPSFARWKAAWAVAAATIPASLVTELLLLQTRLVGSKRLFAVGSLGSVILSTALCVVLVVGFHWGLLGAVVGQSAAKVASAGVLLWGLRNRIAFEWDAAGIRRVLRHTLPIVPGYWLGSFSTHASRFFIFGEMGAAQAAILAVCLKVVSVIGLFSLSFRMAWQPLAMMNLDGNESGKQFSEAMRLFLIGGLLSVCALAILARPVVSILAPPSYAEAARYVAFFAMAAIIGEIGVGLQLGNQVAGKTFWLSVGAILGTVVNIAALALLMRSLGIRAVVLGALASSLVRMCLAYTTSQANYTVAYDAGAFLRFGLGCALVGVMTVLDGRVGPVFSIGSFAATGVVLSWMSLTEHEKRLALGLVGARWPDRGVKWRMR